MIKYYIFFISFTLLLWGIRSSEAEIIGEALEISQFKDAFYGINKREGVSVRSTICINEINEVRRQHGKSAFSFDQNLDTSAYNHNAHMVNHNCFSHQCDGEPGLGDRVSNAGYRWSGIGEVIAAGQGDCPSAVQSWMNSQGHRDILLGDFRHLGCSGLYCDRCDYNVYWTCNVGNPM